MQFGDFDSPHSYQPRQNSRRLLDAARSISRRIGKLLGSPLAIVLLVWGFLFLILSVTLACAQEAGHAANQRPASARGDKKTETIEIFSAGEDLVIPPKAPAVKSSSRRHAFASERRTRRSPAYGK